MNLFSFILILILIGVDAAFRLLEKKERQEFLNRFMARDYRQFQYFQGEYKKDLKEKEAIREEAREERDDFRKNTRLDEEIKEIEKGEPKIKVEDFEEDWPEEGVEK